MKKKLHFLFSVLALMLFAVGTNAQSVKPVPKASPLADDGNTIQYLYNVEAGAFMLGANEWKTRASVSETKGYQFKVTKGTDGATWRLIDYVESKNNWYDTFAGKEDDIWVDRASQANFDNWVITPMENNQFKISNKAFDGYLAVVPAKFETRLYISADENDWNVWIAVSQDDYNAYISELNTYTQQNVFTSKAPAVWEGRAADYTIKVDGNDAIVFNEKYAKPEEAPLPEGDILTQTLTGLKNGAYKVTFEAGASVTNPRDNIDPSYAGDDRAVAFAQDVTRNLTIVERIAVSEADKNVVSFVVPVTDGTLKYGIRNLVPAGNWYIARLISIEYVSEDTDVSAYTHTINVDVTGGDENSITTDVTEDREGSRIFFNVAPLEKYYTYKEISITYEDGAKVVVPANDATTSASNSFRMPDGDVTIKADIRHLTIDIAEGIENGYITAPATEANLGDRIVIIVAPEEGYELDELIVTTEDGESVAVAGQAFLMPAAAVTVSATFKEKEKVQAIVKMTYVDYDNPDTAIGEVTEAKAGYNKISNGKVDFGNLAWACNWVTYISVDASTIGNANIKSATLKAKVSGSTDDKRTTTWGVGYNSSEWSDQLTYNTADLSITQIGEEFAGTNKPSTRFDDVTFDITEAFANGNNTVTLVVYETAAAGGWIKDVTVEIETADKEIVVDGIVYAIKSDNLFKNGSFDEKVEGWKAKDYDTDAVLSDFVWSETGGFDGGAYLTTDGKGVGSEKTIRQSIGVTPVKQYYFTVYTSGQAPDANNIQYNSLFRMQNATTEYDPSRVITPFNWPQGASQTTDEWNQTEYVFIAEDDFVSVRLGWNSNTKFDGFALYEVEMRSSALDLAKAEKRAALDKLAPIGDGPFQYSPEAIEAAKAAVEAAETVDEVKAVEIPTPNAPDPAQPYAFTVKTSKGTWTLSMENGIKVVHSQSEMFCDAVLYTGTPIYLVPQTNGTYAIANRPGDAVAYDFVNYEGSNNWTLKASTSDVTTPYGWTITALPNGGYTITGKNGFLGTNKGDGDDVQSPCYGDKKDSNGNYIWYITPIPSVEPLYADTPLTKEMFQVWDGTDAKAAPTGDEPTWDAPAFGIKCAEGETLYGNAAVDSLEYADITGARTLRIVGTPGLVTRVMLNARKVVHIVDDVVPAGAKIGYEVDGDTVVKAYIELNPTIAPNGVVDIDLTPYAYVHLNAINVQVGSAGAVYDLVLDPTTVVPEVVSIDLTKEMFKTWDGFDASANVVGNYPYWDAAELGTNVSAGATVYGSGNVTNTDYADISAADVLRVVGTPGIQLRVLLNRQADNSLVELNPTIGDEGYADVDLTSYDYAHLNAIKLGWGSPAGVIEALTLLINNEPALPNNVYEGYIAARVSHPAAGEIAKKTDTQTVIIADVVDGMTSITFSNIDVAPMVLSELTIDNVAVTENADGSVSYSCKDVTITRQNGMMTTTYNASLTGTKASADATPVLTLTVAQAMELTVVFAATKEEAEAPLAGLVQGVDSIGTDAVKSNGKYLENGKIVIIRNGVKYNVNGTVVK